MASSDDIADGSISSVLADSSNQHGDGLSPEELDWVDSCLVKDPDISDGEWSSMKDALIEILDLQPKSNDNYSIRETDVEMLHSAEVETGNNISGRIDIDVPSNNKQIGTSNDKQTGTSNDDFPTKEETNFQLSQTPAFLPNYRENNHREAESVGSGLDVGYLDYEVEPPMQDIFRVWDLGFPDEEEEEDELVKQLKKALSESKVHSTPLKTDDSEAWKDLKEEESVDDLIAGLADLSLNQHSD